MIAYPLWIILSCSFYNGIQTIYQSIFCCLCSAICAVTLSVVSFLYLLSSNGVDKDSCLSILYQYKWLVTRLIFSRFVYMIQKNWSIEEIFFTLYYFSVVLYIYHSINGIPPILQIIHFWLYLIIYFQIRVYLIIRDCPFIGHPFKQWGNTKYLFDSNIYILK